MREFGVLVQAMCMCACVCGDRTLSVGYANSRRYRTLQS